MKDKSLEKSLKRANSGGTHKFLNTRFLNLEDDFYKFEVEFSKQCQPPTSVPPIIKASGRVRKTGVTRKSFFENSKWS